MQLKNVLAHDLYVLDFVLLLMDTKPEFLVFYDGQCGVCARLMQWLKARKPIVPMKFLALQSAEAIRLLEYKPIHIPDADSIHCRIGEQWYIESSALIKIAINLGGTWRIIYLSYLIPKSLRDKLYRWVAKNRHCYLSENQ